MIRQKLPSIDYLRECIEVDVSAGVGLGVFATPEEAHQTYLDFTRKIRGQFAPSP